MIDQSPSKIAELSLIYDYEFYQLRTPLTNYALAGVPYGLDNGCFSKFEKTAWLRLVSQAKESKPVFVTMPDIVGDARRTREMFDYFEDEVQGLPLALVLQDGIANVDIPWKRMDAVFVGGSDQFKIAPEAFAACKAAKMMGKWVHVGRVNTVERLSNWIDIADSIDGTGFIKDKNKLDRMIGVIKGNHPQQKMSI